MFKTQHKGGWKIAQLLDRLVNEREFHLPTPLMALYRGVFVDPKFESELGGRASEASDGSELGEGGQCGRPRQPGKLGIKPPARVLAGNKSWMAGDFPGGNGSHETFFVFVKSKD